VRQSVSLMSYAPKLEQQERGRDSSSSSSSSNSSSSSSSSSGGSNSLLQINATGGHEIYHVITIV
jgi:hypothetical protein